MLRRVEGRGLASTHMGDDPLFTPPATRLLLLLPRCVTITTSHVLNLPVVAALNLLEGIVLCRVNVEAKARLPRFVTS